MIEFSRRWVFHGAACVALLAAAGGAAAQELPPLPKPEPERAPAAIERPANVGATLLKVATPTSITYLLAKAPVRGEGGLWNVSFREEATQPTYVARNGGASANGAATVDCGARKFQLQSFSLFPRNNLGGAPVLQLYSRTQWQTPGSSTLIWRVVDMACGGSGGETHPGTDHRPARLTDPPALTHAAATAPSPLPLPLPLPSSSPPPAASAAGGHSYWVQIGAPDSEALARGLLAKLDGAGLLRDLGRDVRETNIHGARVFRSLVGPFSDRRSAAALCTSLTAQNHPCFVRID